MAVYADGATRSVSWCVDRGAARIRQLAVRRFASWLTAGGEIHTDPFPGFGKPSPPLTGVRRRS